MAEHGSTLARTLHEVAHYPPHPPRHPTALYTRNHHQLVVVLDRPCLICGVRHSTLGDTVQNPRGATAIETHHHTVEDSLANAVSLEKFNARVLPGLLHKTGNHEKYSHPLTQDEMLEWIHGDEDNLWCLCDVCHRHPLVGVHAITYPIWSVQDLLMDGYDLTDFHAVSPVEAAALAGLPTTVGIPTVLSPVAAVESRAQAQGVH
jgi:hypothetical protein